MERARLSLNQITIERCNLEQAVAACSRHGIPHIGVWRHKLDGLKIEDARRLIGGAGLRVSSVCRGGMFPAPAKAERQRRIDDNLRAIDEASELGAEVLVLVCGPAADRDIAAARKMVDDGIAAIAPHARACGVRLGIEPLHPMFAADRSVITSLAEANALAAKFDAAVVGVVIDVFHVWWDFRVYEEIQRSAGRIFGFHVSDWQVPLPDVLLGRAMIGDGVIELRELRQAVDEAGYRGPIEVEIFNQSIWDSDPNQVLATMCKRFEEVV